MSATQGLTDRQFLLLWVIGEGSGRPADWWLDLDQILEKLRAIGWDVSKPSLQFSIRSLVSRNYIEKLGFRQRGNRRQRRILAITDFGRGRLKAALDTGRLEVVQEAAKGWKQKT